LAFSNDGNYVYASGLEGNIYNFDLRTRRCVSKFVDEGSSSTVSLAASPDGQFLASGYVLFFQFIFFFLLFFFKQTSTKT